MASSLPPLPPREPKRTNWRKSILMERSARRASTLYGPGGPATQLDFKRSTEPDDWNKDDDNDIRATPSALKLDYLYRLSKALMLYGAPGHRLEGYLTMTARALAVDVAFTYLPDSMTMYIEDPKTETSQARLIKGAGTDLGRWLDVHNVSKHVINNDMSVQDGLYKLKEIESRMARHNEWFLVLIYGFAGIGIAPFAYGARFIDLPLCFVLSIGLGILQLKIAPLNHLYSVLFEVSAAIIFSFLARMFGSIKNAGGDRVFCYAAISESAINLIQPGYWITNACLELMNRQIATSGARIMYALVYALLLAYGVTVGSSLYGLIDHDAASSTVCDNPISRNWNLFFVPFFSLQVAILGGAKWSQLPVMVFITFGMYCAFFYTGPVTNNSFTMAATVGGLAMGLLGNAYARIGRRIEMTLGSMFPRRPRPEMETRTKGTSAADPESAFRGSSTRSSTAADLHMGYTCAAAAMVPAMIVLVPSGLANKGSHLGGILAADAIIRNQTQNSAAFAMGEIMTAVFPVYLNVIQIGLSIAVGLSVGALVLYPTGKNRSGIMSW